MDERSNLQSLTRFRAAAIRRSAFLSWLVLIALVAQAVSRDVIAQPRFLMAASGFVVLLALVTAANWTNLLATGGGPWLAWFFTIATTGVLGTIASIPPMFSATQPLFPGVVVLTGLILEPVRHWIVTTMAVLAMVVAAIAAGVGTTSGDVVPLMVIPGTTLLVVAAATGLIGSEFEREARRSNQRLVQLQHQREDFERLYAVSATLAGAESLSEGLPQIVGTICRYLNAQVGVVFLYHPSDHTLKVMSPMWVNGHTLDVGDIKIKMSDRELVPQVFRSGRPLLLDRISENVEHHGIISELGLTQAMIAPLRVEGYNVGVVMVGDPQNGEFQESQLDVFASLAAPAALVLSQLGRYEAAAEMTRRMQEVAQMKTDFVSVVSHELRTPLTSIIGSLDTMVRPELSESATRELLASARRQAGRLQRLIDDLLMVSRIDRNSVPVVFEPIDVRALLEEIAKTVQGIDRITVSVEPDHLIATGDPDHLRRVFINLVENAGKYAPDSPVELVGRQIRNRIDVDVVDHGEGIIVSERERIFDAFSQVERSDTRTRGGTGLGLSIVKGLVEAMHGRVSISDTPLGGATFTVTLPPWVADESLEDPGGSPLYLGARSG